MLSAKFLGETVSPVGAIWRHYELQPGGPLPRYVIVSAVYAMFTGDETYIFAANDAGQVTGWIELEGSFRGSKDHEMALRNAGYGVLS